MIVAIILNSINDTEDLGDSRFSRDLYFVKIKENLKQEDFEIKYTDTLKSIYSARILVDDGNIEEQSKRYNKKEFSQLATQMFRQAGELLKVNNREIIFSTLQKIDKENFTKAVELRAKLKLDMSHADIPEDITAVINNFEQILIKEFRF